MEEIESIMEMLNLNKNIIFNKNDNIIKRLFILVRKNIKRNTLFFKRVKKLKNKNKNQTIKRGKQHIKSIYNAYKKIIIDEKTILKKEINTLQQERSQHQQERAQQQQERAQQENRANNLENEIKNVKEKVSFINNSATSDVFTTPLIFVKRVKTYKEFQVYEREKHLATLLKKFDWYPEMLYSDDVNQLFIFTNVGVPITSKTKPTDLERQFNKILSDLKSINVKHNDIKIGELLVDKNNKLYLCDFGWASVNNDLGCGIGLYDCEKPEGILDDNSTLERLNLL